ncbi:MAG: methyltransferase domain-containing protein, partial [Geminicoccaceae bacterium]
EHFDSIAERYYVARAHRNHRLLKNLMWGNFFEAHQEFAGRNITVLEPMCGYADGKEILERHLHAAIDYQGFDFSSSVIARLRRDRPDLKVWQADVTTCELGRDCYDLILLLGGLHHVPDAAASVVQLLASALKPGGLFISLEPTYGNPLFKKARELIYRRNSLSMRAQSALFPSVRSLGSSNAPGSNDATCSFLACYHTSCITIPTLSRRSTLAARGWSR